MLKILKMYFPHSRWGSYRWEGEKGFGVTFFD